jgi:hypothetical protein
MFWSLALRGWLVSSHESKALADCGEYRQAARAIAKILNDARFDLTQGSPNASAAIEGMIGIGAKSYGMRTAFIARRKRPFGQTPHQPDLIVANFTELAAALT